MGRKPRLHDYYVMCTLFKWQYDLLRRDIGDGVYKNRRDGMEDFLLEHYAKRNNDAAEYLVSKKLARKEAQKEK